LKKGSSHTHLYFLKRSIIKLKVNKKAIDPAKIYPCNFEVQYLIQSAYSLFTRTTLNITISAKKMIRDHTKRNPNVLYVNGNTVINITIGNEYIIE
jgi:hypothetical protein